MGGAATAGPAAHFIQPGMCHFSSRLPWPSMPFPVDFVEEKVRAAGLQKRVGEFQRFLSYKCCFGAPPPELFVNWS